MPLSRLLYVSENQIEPANMLRELQSILSASRHNNQPLALTGALMFDEMWFVQALEGERRVVTETFDRLRDDERHARVMLVELVEVPRRTFGNWWMGIASRTKDTQQLFAPHCRNSIFRPDEMRAAEILELMIALTEFGLHRELAGEAA